MQSRWLGKSGMIVVQPLGCHFPSYRRTLGSTVRASLMWNPIFLFLKSNFGSRKETTGKYAGFHAVFCGQSSISLHSSAKWGLLLWLLYCSTVEVGRAKKHFFSDYFEFFIVFLSFLKRLLLFKYPLFTEASKLWFSPPVLHANT